MGKDERGGTPKRTEDKGAKEQRGSKAKGKKSDILL